MSHTVTPADTHAPTATGLPWHGLPDPVRRSTVLPNLPRAHAWRVNPIDAAMIAGRAQSGMPCFIRVTVQQSGTVRGLLSYGFDWEDRRVTDVDAATVRMTCDELTGATVRTLRRVTPFKVDPDLDGALSLPRKLTADVLADAAYSFQRFLNSGQDVGLYVHKTGAGSGSYVILPVQLRKVAI